MIISFFVLFSLVGFCKAELEVDGIFYCDLQTNSPRSTYSSWDFSKLRVNLKVFEGLTSVYIPVTLKLTSPISLIKDDVLNIPYYISMKNDIFRISLSSRPVGEQKYGFVDLKDPLGIGRRPNSLQPVMTLKAEMDNPKTEMKAYVILDQKVSNLPILEAIPAGEDEIGNQVLAGRPISDYSFIDEVAHYNFVRSIYKGLDRTNVGFIFAQKNVTSPDFRLAENSTARALRNWGYSKENIGIDIQRKFNKDIEVTGAIVASNVNWKKYAQDPAYESQGRYYPFEVKGEFQGKAANFRLEKAGDTNIRFEGFLVDPFFQTVAATHRQFPVLMEIKTENDGTFVGRNMRAIFDPNFEYQNESPYTSPALQYLGKRALTLLLQQPGTFISLPVQLEIVGTNVSGLSGNSNDYYDTFTGAELIKTRATI